MSRFAARRLAASVAALAALLTLSACDHGPELRGGGGDGTATTLIPSPAYAKANSAAEAAERVVSLRKAMAELREGTASGWVGRQDDVTGFLGDLSGGKFLATADDTTAAVLTAFMSEYGAELFGIDGTDLVIDPATDAVATGTRSVRVSQQIDEVPVVDSNLVVTLTGDDETALNGIRGRVFPGLDVSTTPTLTAKKAKRVAVRLSDGTVTEAPELMVLPKQAGILTWRVPVFAAGEDDSGLALADGDYYLDAGTGKLLEIRATTGSLAAPSAYSLGRSADPHLSAKLFAQLKGIKGEPAEVSGTNDVLGEITANGLRTTGGYALADTTTPTYDSTTEEGGIFTYDADNSSDTGDLPGELYVSPGQEIADGEALGAQFMSRLVYDYYGSLGRRSWDDRNSRLDSTVNFGSDGFCNAFFSSQLPGMVYGNPCDTGDGPVPLVAIDVTGHEITHGVTESSAGLAYSGQSGALNESFSDYFGNVIGDAYRQTDSNTVGEESCTEVTGEGPLCRQTSSGDLGIRDMLNGATMNDYLAQVALPDRYLRLLDDVTDMGGVHQNSAIWNNALWTIRTRLAQIDGEPMVDSDLAQDFDKIVYYTLANKLVSTSSLADAAAAIEETIREAGADPVIARTASEVFEANALCAGCYDPGPIKGEIVSNTSTNEQQPAILEDGRILWIDDDGGAGTVNGEDASNLPASSQVSAMALAGSALLTIDWSDAAGPQIVFTSADGTSEPLAGLSLDSYLASIAGSDEGAVFMTPRMNALVFVDSQGNLQQSKVRALGGEEVTSVATGGGAVAVGGEDGSVAVGTPGSPLKRIGSLPETVLNVAISGDKVIALDADQNAVAFDLAARTKATVTDGSVPLGAAVNGDYAVFPIVTGSLDGKVNELSDGAGIQIDLAVYSFETGQIYNPVATKGQQAFPTLSADGTLVWQDGSFGGDSILKVDLPAGL